MATWLRRLRGAFKMGLTWAAGWAPVGAVTGWLTATVLGFPLSVVVGNFAALFAVLGLGGGAIFFTVLSVAERRHTFAQLSMPRFIGWGALGGVLLGSAAIGAGILGAGATMVGVAVAGAATLLGAGSAAATLAIARAGSGPTLKPGPLVREEA